MERTGCIYKIENKINNKVYIGQTVQNPFDRLKEHFRHCIVGDIKVGLYADMHLYGISAFTIEIVEDDIAKEDLDAKEIYYISKFNCITPNGYNLTRGGQYSEHSNKLTQENVREIISRIRAGAAFKDLATVFNVNYSTISDINCGDTWHFKDEIYPIRQQTGAKKNFSEDIIQEIYSMLKQGFSLTAIGSKFGTSAQTIRRINLGEIYTHDDMKYPIRKFARSNISNETLLNVLFDLENTKLSYNDIARKYDIDRHTVSAINDGTRYSARVEKLGYTYFPIRN